MFGLFSEWLWIMIVVLIEHLYFVISNKQKRVCNGNNLSLYICICMIRMVQVYLHIYSDLCMDLDHHIFSLPSVVIKGLIVFPL